MAYTNLNVILTSFICHIKANTAAFSKKKNCHIKIGQFSSSQGKRNCQIRIARVDETLPHIRNLKFLKPRHFTSTLGK